MLSSTVCTQARLQCAKEQGVKVSELPGAKSLKKAAAQRRQELMDDDY